MEIDYKTVIDYIVSAGKRILPKSGIIKDIGVLKSNLTEEDIAIEKGFEDLIKQYSDDHVLFAEEENNIFKQSDDVWTLDPISGTHNLIRGLPHYAIVATHLHKNEAVFATVYDPSVDELFTAYKDGGAFLNNSPIKVKQVGGDKINILFNYSMSWKDTGKAKEIWIKLFDFKTYRNTNSFAINYCYVAAGRFDGVVALSKDAFPEYAGGLIIKEAGGIFTNLNKESTIKPDDRVFVGGNSLAYGRLFPLVKNTFSD